MNHISDSEILGIWMRPQLAPQNKYFREERDILIYPTHDVVPDKLPTQTKNNQPLKGGEKIE